MLTEDDILHLLKQRYAGAKTDLEMAHLLFEAMSSEMEVQYLKGRADEAGKILKAWPKETNIWLVQNVALN